MLTKSKYDYGRHYSDPPPREPWKKTTLKQKALWVSALVFWLVAACTFFAMKTQEQMTPQVTTTQAESSFSSESTAKLPLDCLQVDSDGVPHLYAIYEGTGWEAGVRVQEVQGFSIEEGNVLLSNGGWGEYVQYASKPLTEGELVEVIRGGDKTADQWLAVFTEDAPELDSLDTGVEVIAQDGNAILLFVESDQRPFMEGRAKSLVPELAGARVYSLADMEQFMGNFVCSGLLLAIFVIVFALWGYAWYENQIDKRYPRLWPLSLGIGIFLLGGIAVILRFVSLPSSLLPPEHITDLGYYFYESDQFFGALERFAGKVNSADALLQRNTLTSFGTFGLMVLGGGIAAAVIRLEDFLMDELLYRKFLKFKRLSRA